jgi:site-specific recombinase XerD
LSTTEIRPQQRVAQRVEQPLNLQQLAFVRSWAEGLDVAQAWHRYMYLEGTADARRARGELARLLERMRILARSHGRADLAALLRRDPERIVEGRTVAVPTLEEFAEQQPADFYSQAELLELYQAEYGAAQPDARSSARRRQRLRERLVLAVQWFNQVVAKAPAPTDLVSAWLDERVAERLRQVGVLRLQDLMDWVRIKRFHWYRPVPRLGPQGAARIVRWLREHASTLGPLPSPALAPRSQIDTARLTPAARLAVVPLERFSPPADPHRSGALGTNRASLERCKINAGNDFEAIQAWLGLRVPGTHTWRAYRKEAERFLLWAVLERGKALSSLDGQDCVAYRDFLRNPGPSWIGPRNEQRWSESWRPFEGPLSVGSADTGMTIVRSLCEWLVRRNYLDSNPWDDVPKRPDAPSMPQLRAFSQKQWSLVQDWLDAQFQQPPSPALHRLKFLLDFAYMSGMRLAELAAAKVGWLRHEQLDDGEWAWSIMVLGKRKKWREVPLPDPAVQALGDYLSSRGLSRNPEANRPDTPLLSHLGREAALTTSRIYEILATTFERCAVDVYTSDRRAADRIREASTHWLRHTYGSHSAARGVPQDVLQANLGHESLATTSIYMKSEKSRRHKAMQQAFRAAERSPPDEVRSAMGPEA